MSFLFLLCTEGWSRKTQVIAQPYNLSVSRQQSNLPKSVTTLFKRKSFQWKWGAYLLCDILILLSNYYLHVGC